MPTISSNHFSHDQQLADAMAWLAGFHPDAYAALMVEYPEWETRKWEMFGSQLDCEAMGVDVEWAMWLTDAVEATDLVMWSDGEPWVGPFDHDDLEGGF